MRSRLLATTLGIAAITVSLLGTLAPVATAAPEYGKAVVEQGVMTITREGASVSYKKSSSSISVNEKDLVRLRDDSRVVLKTREGATLAIGSNAVFQCEPWESANHSGVFRMLFGRFRADVLLHTGEKSFAVKTRTATIGVKGTVYTLAETSNGNTAILGSQGTVTVAGALGGEQWVGPNQTSIVVGDTPATTSITAPDELKKALGSLNSPRLGSEAALVLPAEIALVDKGIVSKEALEKSKADKGKVMDTKGLPEMPFAPLNLDDSPGSTLRGSNTK